jgi:hypothetical protein
MSTAKVGENVINSYAIILEEVGTVAFEVEDILYRIFQRDDESWEIGVYREDLVSAKVGEVYAFVEIDGGICTGSSVDAVEFFL